MSEKEEKLSFMVANRAGSFCLMSDSQKSRFEGLFFREGNKVFKTIENIRLAKPVTKLTNHLWSVTREREDITENFFMPLGRNIMIYKLSESSEFDLILDCKEIYDNREWGRYYEISKESGHLIIKFSKKNDDKEDKKDEFEFYITLYSDELEYKPMQSWEKISYALDKERNSPPFDRHVINICRLRCREVVFSFSENKKKAMKEAKQAWKRKEKLRKESEEYVRDLIHKKKIRNEESAVSYQCSVNALDSLTVKGKSISAGLPWFFQSWARDELISLKAFITIEEFDFVKDVLMHNLESIGHDGKLYDKDIKSELRSADAVLWLFKRFEDFIDALEKKGITDKYLSSGEIDYLKEKLQKTISIWIKFHTEDGLIINGSKETWMDTDWKDDGREGARIEIQALFLSALRLLRRIDQGEDFEKSLLKKVRAGFFTGRFLKDGADDETIRPNIFIAAYVYPELLTKKQWISCFEYALPKLWLKWGGLSSIEKSDSLFTKKHTGEIPESYHRGDSWFWINNISAIVLHRLDKNKFKKFIKQILDSSINENLYHGVTGYSAELSSADELKSEGCLCQAWSSATLIELIDELY